MVNELIVKISKYLILTLTETRVNGYATVITILRWKVSSSAKIFSFFASHI
jgi:hypothetical protein